jgi:hypothetical protein
MTDDDPGRPFFLRCFPDELRRRLEDEAKASERTLSAEIRHRLKQSLNKHKATQVTA